MVSHTGDRMATPLRPLSSVKLTIISDEAGRDSWLDRCGGLRNFKTRYRLSPHGIHDLLNVGFEYAQFPYDFAYITRTGLTLRIAAQLRTGQDQLQVLPYRIKRLSRLFLHGDFLLPEKERHQPEF